jgi:glycosyltransferase involved in cell wall biosynthesis
VNQRLILDISRLLLAAWRQTPSGIERVEMAYAKRLRQSATLDFAAANVFRHLCILPRRLAFDYLDALEQTWTSGGSAPRRRIIQLAIVINAFILGQRLLRPRVRFSPQNRGAAVLYINLSHENLTRPHVIGRFIQSHEAKVVLFIHDLIPLEFPEYVRPGQAALHRARLETALALADALLVNSNATRQAVIRHAGTRSVAPIHVLPLAVHGNLPIRETNGPAPYFVCLGTIEPRKNHLLLLHVWRSLAATEVIVPRLLVIGRRGWENEMVVDMLERCADLAGHVEERPGVTDDALRGLLAGARALLLPSFAEGFGLPVAEALRSGTPAICSDLPALREAGGLVPEYLDPLDGLAWRQAILDYATPGSPRRQAQLERLRHWQPPSWSDHFAAFDQVIAALCSPLSEPRLTDQGRTAYLPGIV